MLSYAPSIFLKAHPWREARPERESFFSSQMDSHKMIKKKKTILQTIITKNGELQNSVVILTYGMLQNLPILQDIARQRGHAVAPGSDVIVRAS